VSERTNPFAWVRYGLVIAQSVTALFSTGAVLYGAHTLFLRYYAREWEGVQIAGVNGCAGAERVVNGDLFEGQTLCNQPENFVPWVEIYRRHWQVAAAYYGTGLAAIFVIGFLLVMMQRRLAPRDPFGAAPSALAPENSEHLR
jgi:hypothetical protein